MRMKRMFVFLFIALNSLGVYAFQLSWDTINNGITLDDGPGIWKVGTTTFNDGSSSIVWSNGNDVAIGNGGIGGIITVSGTVIPNSILFLPVSSNYTLSGGTITLSSADTTITTNGTASPVINSVLAGTGGVRKMGVGTLTLGGTNTYTGDTNINEGKIIATNANAFGLTGRIFITNGATLDISALNFSGQDSIYSRTTVAAGGTLLSSIQTVKYDFESDSLGSSPADMAIEYKGVLKVGSIVGINGKGVTVSTNSGAQLPIAALLSKFPTANDYSVIRMGVGSGINYRNGMILRGQATPYYKGNFTGARLGYLFQSKATSGILQIVRISSGSLYQPGSRAGIIPSIAPANTPRWYKAAAIGSGLTFAYSDISDKGPRTQLISVTDSTYTGGYTQYTDGWGNKPLNAGFIDDVTMQYITSSTIVPDQPTTPSVVSMGSTSATFNFTGATGADITQYTITANPGMIVSTGTGSPITISGLSPSTTYAFTLSAQNSAGSSIDSDPYTGTTQAMAEPTIEVSITSPLKYQVIQRDISTNKGDIVIIGTYTGSLSGIEASWNSGSFVNISASMSAGNFTGILSNQIGGQGTLAIRATNNTGVTASVTDVGVGDIFVVAGQSNAAGWGANPQIFTGTNGIAATLFGNDYIWKKLVDPYDNDTNQIDIVSLDAGSNGSFVPLLATKIVANQNVPVAFVPTAMGGTAITSRTPGTGHFDRSTLYGSMAYRIKEVGGKIAGVIRFQGESDAMMKRTTSAYQTSLNTIINTVQSDFSGTGPIKRFVGSIGPDNYSGYAIDAIRKAQQEIYLSNSLVYPTNALTYDINIADEGGGNLHFRSNGELESFSQRRWNAIAKEYYGLNVNTPPRILSTGVIVYTQSNSLVLTFDTPLAEQVPSLYTNNLSGITYLTGSTQAFSISGANISVQSVSLSGTNSVVLALSGTIPTSGLLLNYANGNSGVNKAIYSQDSYQPAYPIYGSAITVIDNSAPIILLSGSGSVILAQGSTYVDSGASWTDNVDGSGSLLAGIWGATGSFASSGNVDINIPGTYYVQYNKIDVAGNGTIATRTIYVVDSTPISGTIGYSTTGITNGNVTATISLNKTGTITNNGGSNTYIFTGNGNFTFNFIDVLGNTGSTVATVNNIDKSKNIDVKNNSNDVIELTGKIVFEGGTNTGVQFARSGKIILIENNGSGQLEFNTDGLTILTSGGWNMEMLPPSKLLISETENAEFGEPGIPQENENNKTRKILLTIKAGSTGAQLTATGGGNFKLSFIVENGIVGENLKIYRSSDGYHREENGPDKTCTLDNSKTCVFYTDHLSYFTTIRETTNSDNGGGINIGGGITLIKDSCPNGDSSPSYYDKICGDTNKENSELENAYDFAYKYGITTKKNILEANMEGIIIRIELAKMISNYAFNVLGKTINNDIECQFDDINNLPEEMKSYAIKACQLGLMGQDTNGKFNPNGEITRAEFGTIVSRVLRQNKYNSASPIRYTEHLNALEKDGIMKNIETPMMKELRGYVMLMLMRTK